MSQLGGERHVGGLFHHGGQDQLFKLKSKLKLSSHKQLFTFVSSLGSQILITCKVADIQVNALVKPNDPDIENENLSEVIEPAEVQPPGSRISSSTEEVKGGASEVPPLKNGGSLFGHSAPQPQSESGVGGGYGRGRGRCGLFGSNISSGPGFIDCAPAQTVGFMGHGSNPS